MGEEGVGLGVMRIGVIADTHGLFRPEVLAVFAGVDHIVHAGDIGGDHVIAALREIAPVTFVRGNNDDADGTDIVRVTIAGLRVLLTHILPRPREPARPVVESLRTAPADIVVFGHSHLPHNEVIDGVRYFNPASAGPRRFDYPIAAGLIEDGRAYHVALDERSRPALEKRMNQLSRR
ncbi:MAG TPA: metallophosphoesterase family protein [Thermoanaerobaculia bacterium]|nr:metallophosphoesterase family protein [Thermoanaerobaculia bacterium]